MPCLYRTIVRHSHKAVSVSADHSCRNVNE
ncbi:hypothetical protein CGRA01v4_11680 [Colletotrichum graminicola]|nr:hypothetical protein CGRA01v4_11680 [Colletotrichum graminicola]